jgi:hypothetical protein
MNTAASDNQGDKTLNKTSSGVSSSIFMVSSDHKAKQECGGYVQPRWRNAQMIDHCATGRRMEWYRSATIADAEADTVKINQFSIDLRRNSAILPALFLSVSRANIAPADFPWFLLGESVRCCLITAMHL